MCALYKGIEVPDNDAERVESLKSYQLLDTSPEHSAENRRCRK